MWHVGIIYRIPDLLFLVESEKISTKHLIASFPNKFRNIDISSIINTAITGGWLKLENDNFILTKKGHSLIEISGQPQQLRKCIDDLIEVSRPVWAAFAIQGRSVVKDYAPAEVVQCLEEAGYFDSNDEEIIKWWDHLAVNLRKDKNSELLKIGRIGERKSFNYEYNRTGKYPEWRSLEYAGLGYDIISQLTPNDTRKILIEVKTSTKSWEKASFFLSKNEWNVLSKADFSFLHLWSLSKLQSNPSIIEIVDLLPHIPEDRGDAEWQDIRCPFSAFSYQN